MSEWLDMAPGIAPGMPPPVGLPPPIPPGGAAPTVKLSEASTEAVAIRVDFFMTEVPQVAVIARRAQPAECVRRAAGPAYYPSNPCSPVPVAASRQAVGVHAKTLGRNTRPARAPFLKRFKHQNAYPHIRATASTRPGPPP